MKIGIISDLHSNIHVLDEILKKEKEIERWFCLGDFVGLFPSVNKVINRLKKEDFLVISGDHEDALLKEIKILQSITANEAIKKQKKILTSKNRAYLMQLKERFSLKIEDAKILMIHSLTRKAKIELNFAEISQKFSEYDVVFFGHSHYPLIFYSGKTIFINPGSAGFPIDKLKLPSYVIFNLSDFTFEHKRIDFNRQALLKDIKNNGYNQKLADYIKNGFVWR